jgi:hypothetical protein
MMSSLTFSSHNIIINHIGTYLSSLHDPQSMMSLHFLHHMGSSCLTCNKGNYNAFDAVCLTICNDYDILSPNMDYILAYIFGQEIVDPCEDGYWGYFNPFQMPQAYSSDLLWSCLILLRDMPLALLKKPHWIWSNLLHRYYCQQGLRGQSVGFMV